MLVPVAQGRLAGCFCDSKMIEACLPEFGRLPLALRMPLLMSRNELTSANCINIIDTKCVQVSIPLLYLFVSCFQTTLSNLGRSIRPNICAKRLILELDMVDCFVQTLR